MRVQDASGGWAGAWRRPGIGLLLVLFFVIHGLFLAGDLAHADRFLMGDRSVVRLDKMHALLSAPPGRVLHQLSAAGPPGDYAVHAALLGLGGPVLVIVAQVLMQLIIVLGVYAVMRRLDPRPALAFWAALVTLLLPGELMSPHLLSTETLTTIALCAGVALVCLAPLQAGEGGGRRRVLAGFFLMGLAACVRPQAGLTPVLLWLALPWLGYRRRTLTLGLLIALAVFPLSGMLFNGLVSGAFSIGQNEADLGANLYIRVYRLSELAHFAMPPGDHLGIGPFLTATIHYPVESVRLYLIDVVNLVFNPGANHVFGRYLQLFATEDVFHWHYLMDRQGPLAVVIAIVRTGGVFLALFALATLLHVVMLAGFGASVAGALQRQSPAWPRVMLLAALSILAGSFVSGAVRWSHRAPVEPLLACLAVWGLAWAFGAWRARRMRRAATAH